LDTRKTTPLWRDLEKAAVKAGGGENHRIGLYDMVLIKDNHLELWGVMDPAAAVHRARQLFPDLPIEVEVTTLEQLENVCKVGSGSSGTVPEFILLDNFPNEMLKRGVDFVDNFFATDQAGKQKKRPLLEASGGITLERLKSVAQTGVDRISSGALTHSVKVFDISLEMQLE